MVKMIYPQEKLVSEVIVRRWFADLVADGIIVVDTVDPSNLAIEQVCELLGDTGRYTFADE